jgi:low temperature requirement protein LtrA
MTHFHVSWSLLSPQVAFRALKTHRRNIKNKKRNIISVVVVMVVIVVTVVTSLFLIQLLKYVVKGVCICVDLMPLSIECHF